MFHSLWAQINNPVLYALPVFFVTIVIEAVLLRHADHDGTGYSRPDTRASLSMGGIAVLVYTAVKFVSLIGYAVIWTYLAPWHIPTNTWWSWLLLFLAVDVLWYCYHLFSHRVRIAWAAHQAHHSSEYFNLGTALRQKWNPWIEPIFWIPLPLLGFAPWTIYVAFGFNLIYQFFTHTEAVGRLPRTIEFIFNTPSHHRVHHGSDAEYLDRNYGGILIVWDRMFGTFQREMHTPTYGLTKPVRTFNLFALQYGEYGRIIADVRGARGWRNRLGYIFGPPGWQPQAVHDDTPAMVG